MGNAAARQARRPRHRPRHHGGHRARHHGGRPCDARAAAVRPPLLPNRLGRRRSPWPRADARTPPLAAVRRGRAHAAADARHEALQGPCARAVLCRCEEGRRGGAVPPREAAVRRPPRPHARPAAWPPRAAMAAVTGRRHSHERGAPEREERGSTSTPSRRRRRARGPPRAAADAVRAVRRAAPRTARPASAPPRESLCRSRAPPWSLRRQEGKGAIEEGRRGAPARKV